MRKVIIFILIIGMLTCSFFVYRSNEINRGNKELSSIKSKVITYINSKSGFSEDKYDLKAEYRFDRKLLGHNPYLISVVYKDEPNAIYYYDYSNGTVSQGGISPVNGKTDKNFMHAENR